MMGKKHTDTFLFEQCLHDDRIMFSKEVPISDLVDGYAHGFKMDYCFHRDGKVVLCLEIEGGVWSGGRHVNPVGFLNDMVKYNTIAMIGLVIVRFTSEMIEENPSYCSTVIVSILKNNVNTPMLNGYADMFKVKRKPAKKSQGNKTTRSKTIQKLLARALNL